MTLRYSCVWPGNTVPYNLVIYYYYYYYTNILRAQNVTIR